MKKKLISLVVLTCMVFGLAACGGGKNAMSVTIEGHTYDLSGDIQDVIGDMVKDKLIVMDTYRAVMYDKNGKFSGKSVLDFAKERKGSEKIVYATETSLGMVSEYNIVVSRFDLGNLEISYETAQGIKYRSDEDDIEDLKGYVPYTPGRVRDNPAYAAIYIDGELVDLEEYEDDLEDFLEDVEESAFPIAVREHMPETVLYPESCSVLNQNVLVDAMSFFDEDVLEGSLLIGFAAQEAGKMLEKEKIDSYDIIVYESAKEGMIVTYYHYYYDDNWDRKKFLDR